MLKSKKFLLSMCLCALFFTASCFEISRKVTLNKDLSGSTTLVISYNMESFINKMAAMQAKYKKGTDVEALKKKMRADVLKKLQAEKKKKPKLADVQKRMPKGFTMNKIDMDIKGLQVTMTLGIGFQDIRKLSKLNIQEAMDGKKKKKSKRGNPMDSFLDMNMPFSGMTVTEEGNVLVIESVLKKGGKLPPQMSAPGALKGLSLTYTLSVPFKVLKHNATKVEGTTYIWKSNQDTWKKMKAGHKAFIKMER